MRFRFLAGSHNAVVSGVFFDSAGDSASAGTARYLGTDTVTQGSWKGKYGKDGYELANDGKAHPAYATVTVQNKNDYTWKTSTTDVRALEKTAEAGRLAVAWYSGEFTIDIQISDGKSHKVSFYCLDWPRQGRSHTIEAYDPSTGTLLASTSVSQFQEGTYYTYEITGSVRFRFLEGSYNAVVSGVFFD